MPLTIDRIRVERYKKNRIEGKSKTKSLEALGLKYNTAHAHCADSGVAICGEREIAQELDKRGLAEKAYQTLQQALNSPKDSDRIAAAQNILKYTIGEKIETTPDKIIIAYNPISNSNKIIDSNIQQEALNTPRSIQEAITAPNAIKAVDAIDIRL